MDPKRDVEIIETDGSTNNDQTAALQAFAAKIAPLLEGRDTPPEAIRWFPAAHQTSVRLVPQSVLGLRELKRGFVATYDQGQAFVVVEESQQSAAEVMQKLHARFAGVEAVQIADDAFQGKVPYLDCICIFRKGNRIGGYTNLSSAQAAATQAALLAAQLPAN